MVECSGPDDPHAFTGVPLQHRSAALDAPCPLCRGHGQWNARVDLGNLRAERTICPNCEGRGWIETGSDAIAEADIATAPSGRPQWFTRYQEP